MDKSKTPKPPEPDLVDILRAAGYRVVREGAEAVKKAIFDADK